jgi:hypothetical protein
MPVIRQNEQASKNRACRVGEVTSLSWLAQSGNAGDTSRMVRVFFPCAPHLSDLVGPDIKYLGMGIINLEAVVEKRGALAWDRQPTTGTSK